jgi:2'-5' RNA ligase
MKSREKDQFLYFVAILTPDDVSDPIKNIKNLIKKTYGVSKALNSPPHITLFPPFRWQLSKVEILHTSLRKFAENYKAFPIILRGFGAFRPRVIFIGVCKNESLQLLWQDLSYRMKEDIQLGVGPDKRGFHPHITVAFKDLKPAIFYKAWPEFKDRPFEGRFVADHISLLKHNGNRWGVVKTYPFKRE